MAVTRSDLAFVWIWLPGSDTPMPCGRLDVDGPVITFTYGRNYLDRTDALPIYLPELPLVRGPQAPELTSLAGCILDAGPDAWGRHVLDHRAGTEHTTLGYLLESSSNRTGALDFQHSPTEYVPRGAAPSTLASLLRAAELVEDNAPLPAELADALLHGTSIGGARPKADLVDDQRHLIAKFSSTGDTRPVVQGEFVAMTLAARAGLDVAPVEICRVLDKYVLLVERFDRPGQGRRRLMVSANTILRLGEFGVGASYADLADEVRRRFTRPDLTLRELFSRITFNILVGNTDDHAKNHAAFWDGHELTLTPAYDITPQRRTGGEATQAMAIGRDGYRLSQLAGCVERAPAYHLDEADARAIIEHQVDCIRTNWDEVGDLAQLSQVQIAGMWERQFLNPYAFEGF